MTPPDTETPPNDQPPHYTQPERLVVPPHTTWTLPDPTRGATPTAQPACADGGNVLGDNQTYANKLIDVSATGASVHLVADGADWTFANIGITGALAGNGPAADTTQPTVSATVTAGATGTIRTLWLGDPPETTTRDGETVGTASGIAVTDRHAGTLTIDQATITTKPGGGVLATAPTDPDGALGAGSVVVRDSFFAENARADLLLGVPDARVETCVVHTTGDGPHAPDSDRFRCVYQRRRGVSVADSHIAQTGDDYAIAAGEDGGIVAVVGGALAGRTAGPVERTGVADTPLTFRPAGAPRSARDAATREAGEEATA